MEIQKFRKVKVFSLFTKKIYTLKKLKFIPNFYSKKTFHLEFLSLPGA